MLSVKADSIKRRILIETDQDEDLTEEIARLRTEQYLRDNGEIADWSFDTCDRWNYDQVVVIFIRV